MTLNVTIADRAQRDRFQADLKRMRAQTKEMAAAGPEPRQRPGHHRAIVRSARANARDLAAAIKEWDAANPRPRAQRRGR